MKLSLANAALAAVYASQSVAAFTAPRTSIRLGASSATTLQSTLADTFQDVESVPSTQELTDEQQQLNQYISQPEKSFLDDGFVFGLEGSGLERPKGKEANVVVEGDSLETTWEQRAIVSGTIAGQALFAANAVRDLYSQTDGNIEATALASFATIVASYIAADFGSGVFHWSVDNYGNGRTPVMGSIIAAFQGHHSAPWTITYRGFCNNVWKLCIPFGLPTVAAITYLAGSENPMGENRLISSFIPHQVDIHLTNDIIAVSLFFVVFCFSEIMSQELHKWSHQTKKEVPEWINTLQDLGIIIGRKPHAKHHMAPYDGNYCIVSGVCNEALDNSGFFRWLEHRVYEINGVESNAWKLDSELRERTLRGEYQLPA